jgi:hypothetical protein
MAIWRMSFASWIPKAKSTHLEYAILKQASILVLHTLPVLFKITAGGAYSVLTTGI